jgi:hypothetical protein
MVIVSFGHGWAGWIGRSRSVRGSGGPSLVAGPSLLLRRLMPHRCGWLIGRGLALLALTSGLLDVSVNRADEPGQLAEVVFAKPICDGAHRATS